MVLPTLAYSSRKKSFCPLSTHPFKKLCPGPLRRPKLHPGASMGRRHDPGPHKANNTATNFIPNCPGAWSEPHKMSDFQSLGLVRLRATGNQDLCRMHQRGTYFCPRNSSLRCEAEEEGTQNKTAVK